MDAELERGRQLQAGIKAEAQLQLPVRDTAASAKKRNKQMLVVAEGRYLRRQAALDADAYSGPDAKAERRALLWTAGAGAVVVLATVVRRRRRNGAGRT